MTTLTKPKSPKRTRMTTREFLALPPDENCETALIYGDLIVMPKPRPKHNRVRGMTSAESCRVAPNRCPKARGLAGAISNVSGIPRREDHETACLKVL